jgi:hypothetical protein
MKKIIGGLFLVAFLALTSGANSQGTAVAAGGMPNTSTRTSIVYQAKATFYLPIWGEESSVAINATNSLSGSQNGVRGTSEMTLHIDQVSGDGHSRHFSGLSQLAPGQFRVDNALGTAALKAVINVCESTYGASSSTASYCFDVDVAIDWNRIDDAPWSWESRQSGDSGGCQRSTSWFRSDWPVVANGTVAEDVKRIPRSSVVADLLEYWSSEESVGPCIYQGPAAQPPP